MEKRYKTDYFEKIILLASICNDNISYAQKIIASGKFVLDKNIITGKEIMNEVKSSLEKDYFAPLEREDIFMLCEKLNELSENSYFLCTYASDNNFGFPGNIVSLAECLKKASESIHAIFINLSKSKKKTDLKEHISEAEEMQNELKKQLYDCLKHSQSNPYGYIIHNIGKCADICKEITQLIQYTLIKNS